MSCAFVRKDQSNALVVADVVKAVIEKGGDLERAGNCRGCS